MSSLADLNRFDRSNDLNSCTDSNQRGAKSLYDLSASAGDLPLTLYFSVGSLADFQPAMPGLKCWTFE